MLSEMNLPNAFGRRGRGFAAEWMWFPWLLGAVGLIPLLFSAAAAAQDQKHFDVLHTLDGQAYTNAVVSSRTPAYLIVLYDGGGTKVYFTNLDDRIRSDFGYNASAADAFASKEAEKKKAALEASKKEEQAAFDAENAVGDVQSVEVLGSLGGYKYRIKSDSGEGDVVFMTMPAAVSQFLGQEAELEAQRDAAAAQAANAGTAAQRNTVRSRRRAANGNLAGSVVAARASETNQMQAKTAKSEESAVDKTWAKFEEQRPEKATILAAPTGHILYGLRVWKFTGFPQKSEAEQASK